MKRLLLIVSIAALIAGCAPKKTLCGGYSQQRRPDTEEIEFFEQVISGSEYAGLDLKPISLSTQVVAGLNYRYTCRGKDENGRRIKCKVLIFRPLSGDAYVQSVERQ